MTSRSLFAAAFLAVLTVTSFACQETDPAKPATWVAKLDDKDPKTVTDALDHLRKLKAKEAVAPIEASLKSDDGSIREAAAAALEDIGDASAVPSLIAAADLDSSDSAVGRANLKIADALGTLGDKQATPELLKMIKARDALLQAHAVEALDKLKDPQSTSALIALVDNESAPPLVTKWAVTALGDLRSTDAIPVLAKALVMERHGISFFVESSYALFQIGKPAVPKMVGLLDGSDKEYVSWAETERRAAAGYASKAAIVLGDIGDPSAIPGLVAALKWKDPTDNSVWENLVHGKVAEALGRLRAPEAAAPMGADLAKIDDANMRSLFAVALAHIDDKKEIPKLEAAIKNPKDTWTDREETMNGLALFGDAKDVPLFQAVQKTETADKAMKDCLAQDSEEDDATKQARCKRSADETVKAINDGLADLQAGEQCKEDASCWIGKLKDTNPKIRERAAFELGKIGSPTAIDPLVATCKDDTMFVRRAAYIALDWTTRIDADKPALKAKAAQLQTQLDEEKTQQLTQIVNEDLRRVVWKLQQL